MKFLAVLGMFLAFPSMALDIPGTPFSAKQMGKVCPPSLTLDEAKQLKDGACPLIHEPSHLPQAFCAYPSKEVFGKSVPSSWQVLTSQAFSPTLMLAHQYGVQVICGYKYNSVIRKKEYVLYIISGVGH